MKRFSCHPERTGPQAFFSLRGGKRRICFCSWMYQGTTSVVPQERNKIERALAPEETVAQPQQTAEGESTQERLLALAWSALPATYRIPDIAPTLAEARAWCKHLAETHYENFHVASWFLPEALRPHFHAIYAYCRVSDDLGDEVGDTAAIPRSPRPMGPRTRRLLRRPRAPSRLCRSR